MTEEVNYFPSTESLNRPLTEKEQIESERLWDDIRRRSLEGKEEAYKSIQAFKTTKEVADLLGVSGRLVLRWRNQEVLLGIRLLGDRNYRYPEFQFLKNGKQGKDGLLPGVPEVRKLFSDKDPFTISQYLLAKMAGLGGKSAVQILKSGNPKLIAHLHHVAPAYGEQGFD